MNFPWLEIITILLGGTNVTTIFFLRSSMRKEKALSSQEEANSVEKSQQLYDKLTADMDRQYDRLMLKIAQQEITINTQYEQLNLVNRKLEDYRRKCTGCLNSKIDS